MAATHPAECPTRQDPPAEEVEEPGGRRTRDEPRESESDSNKQTGIFTSKSVENSSGGREASTVASDADCVSSHTDAGRPLAGADSLGKPTSIEREKKARDDPDVSCDDQPALKWSDTEDEEEDERVKTREGESGDDHKKNEENSRMRPDVLGEETRDVDAEKPKNEEPRPDETRSTAAANDAGIDPECEAIEGSEELDDDEDDDEEEEGGEEADSSARQRTWRLQCKECGMRFNRRETYNLHRHVHTQQDEAAPLTCKECGLTFQHRSSLLKHRSEHKEREEPVVASKKESPPPSPWSCGRDERSFGCAQCEKSFPTADKLRGHSCASAPDKPYHCPLCRQEFQFKLSITKHMQNHSAENVFACQECSRCFSDIAALRCHQRCHAALKPYHCPDCGMVFKHYSVMEDHRRKHTDHMRTHQCNVCGKTFKYSSLLHQHQYLHTGQKPFRCPDCGKNFAFAQNMKAHCRQHRPQRAPSPLSASEQASEQAPVSPRETGRGPGKENAEQRAEPKRSCFKCPLCPQTSSTPANLRAHMLIHEAEYEKLDNKCKTESGSKNWDKGHTCPHCPSIFRDESSFYGHILKVHKSIAHYLEKVSSASLHKPNPLNADNAQGKWRGDSANAKSYKCSECGKVFRHRSVLELHMRIHSKDKPYQCKVCGKGFRFGSYLQQHLIIHTGKKPYKCPDCGKDFAFLQNMKTHQKLHQEKPFRCTSCRKGYSDESQLQHHMLSHNGDKPHKCDLCDKSFGLAYLLRDHMNTHTGERPHRCDECHKSFSWFSSLLVHQKIHTRKRQGPSQYSSMPPLGVRMRGRGTRGRRGGRFAWGWPRSVAGPPGMPVAPQPPPPPYQVPIMRDPEWQRRAAVQSHTPVFTAQMEPQAQGRPQKEPWASEGPPAPVQWKVDGGEVMPVPLSQQPHQRGPSWLDSPLAMPPGSGLEPPHAKETVLTGNSLVVPKKTSPSAVSEMEQHRQRIGVPTSTVQASTSSSQHEFPTSPSYMDGAALWSIRPTAAAPLTSSPNKLGQELQLPRWSGAPLSIQKATEFNTPQGIPPTVSQSDKPWNGGLASATTSAQIDQSGASSNATSTPHGAAGLWDFQPPAGVAKTLNPPDKLEFQLQQKQLSSWANVQSQASAQKVPISLQYEPHRFPPGLGATVWGFQSNPVGPQTLLAGPPGSGPELQPHQPMVTGTQIIINQPSPFFAPPLAPLSSLALPGAHPLHSVAVGALPRPPHPNIFFTPQAVLGERPHLPQALSLPQLASRTEAHKLGGRLPFAPERLLQCMICGCSLPRELDLQMHYLQHAQGEI